MRNSYADKYRCLASGSRFGPTLTSLISARFSKYAKWKVCVAAEHVKTYTLDTSDNWFEEATRLPATRAWIE